MINVVSMEITSYPRTIAGSVRRVDNTRTLKRKERDEKKAEVDREGEGMGRCEEGGGGDGEV